MRIRKSAPLALLAVAVAMMLCCPRANADFARRLSYQGRLTNSDGVPLASGSYSMTFKLYTVETGGAAIWTEDHTGGNTVSVDNGLFSTVLGGISTLNSINFNGTEYWIEVVVGATTYSPRQRLTAAPFALNVPDGLITATKMADGAALAEIVDDDGAGSGLDCDLLDGYDWSSFPAFADVWVNVSGDTMSGTLDMDNNAIIDIDWPNSDDGAGSGLDADMLDGLQGSDYQRRVSNSCAVGASIRAIAADGTVTCETDDDTTDHGSLSGLGDDDHTQYFHLSQNETVSGIPAFNGGTTGSSAPFSVDSTFLVTNLNADLLDGLHASSFMSASTDDWVNEIGDTMTGNLSIDYAGNPGIELRANSGGTPYIDWSNDAASDYDGRIRLTDNDTLFVEGTNMNFNNSYGIYFAGNTLGNDAARLYTGASNRLFVRAEDVDNVAQFADYGLYLPSPSGSTYNLYTGNGIQTAYSAAANIDWRNGGNITTNSGAYIPISFSSSSGYAHYGNGSGITMGDKPVYLRGSYGSDPNHGMIYNSTVDGPEMRGFTGFIWKTGASGATERMRLTSDPVLITGAYAANKFHTVIGPDTGADNQWHTVQCNSGYAVSQFSVYSTNYWDGNVTLFCSYLGGLINSGAATWEDSTLENCDGCWHYATCSANRVAIGWRAYATGRLDYSMQLLCAPLTTASSTSMDHWMSSQNDEQADDNMHGTACPPGTYLFAMAVYTGSYLDGDARVKCRAPLP